MLCASDFAGQIRGKGFPASDLPQRLIKGIGWTPTNIMISGFGPIAPSPWGPFGDLVIKPDAATRVRVDFGPDQAAEHSMMGDLCHLDGTPWGFACVIDRKLCQFRASSRLGLSQKGARQSGVDDKGKIVSLRSMPRASRTKARRAAMRCAAAGCLAAMSARRA